MDSSRSPSMSWIFLSTQALRRGAKVARAASNMAQSMGCANTASRLLGSAAAMRFVTSAGSSAGAPSGSP